MMEVTPELLASIEAQIALWISFAPDSNYIPFRIQKLSALVARIRELESELRAMRTADFIRVHF